MVSDDSTYVIKNDIVTGRDTDDPEVKGVHLNKKVEFESPVSHYLRFTLVTIVIVALVVVSLWFLIFSFVVCVIMTDRLSSNRTGRGHNPANQLSNDAEYYMRNGRLINLMKKVPYGRFMFKEARDCPICLVAFDESSQVVQLECSRYHIFHYECMEHFLAQCTSTQPTCPLCRKEVKI